MVPHVTAICASCNYYLYRLSSICRYLTVNATRTVVQALITSCLDYCNSLMTKISSTQIERLQRIQNKAARMILRVPSGEHITSTLQQLHWLPVCHRINYKILTTVFKCLHALAPIYLVELLEARQRDKRLRHADTLFLHQRIARKHVGEQAFGTAAPLLWNNLPAQLRSMTTLPTFKNSILGTDEMVSRNVFCFCFFLWMHVICIVYYVLICFICAARWSTLWEVALLEKLFYYYYHY